MYNLVQRYNHPHTSKVMMHETLTYVIDLCSVSHSLKLIKQVYVPLMGSFS